MQSKKQIGLFLIFMAFFAISCSNTYNSLIPNDEQNIMEFSLSSEDHKTRSVSSEIRENYIIVKVPKGTDITHLFAHAVLPKQATLFPLTLRYLQEAFPNSDVVDMALRINPAQKGLEHWFLDLYEENPDFKIPPMVFPINFFYPVKFVVIGGQGGVEIYTVKVVYEDGSEPDVGDLPDPNSDESKKILSFYVPDKQKGSSVITHDSIEFTCKAGVDLRDLLPEITVEEGGVAIPLTREYLLDMSSQLGIDPLGFAQGYMDASDKRAYIKQVVSAHDVSRLNVAIDKPIDFTYPIQIVVLGKLDKSVRLYTATASLDKDEAYLKAIVFTKAKNPALIRDYEANISQEKKEATCTLYYPFEYDIANEKIFHLFIDTQYTGSNIAIEYNGNNYNLSDAIPFKPIKTTNELYHLGTARAKVHIDSGAVRKTYSLKLTFKEDPDTIRSITDFRFETFYNSKIKASAIASITNRDDEGVISASVLYSGEKPDKLIPSFITGGGKVFVQGVEQFSKSSEQDFSAPIEYVCISKDGNYERVYTVIVEFIKVEGPEVALKTFKFPLHLNKEISQDAIGVIDEDKGAVKIEVIYDKDEKPLELIAEFSATGRVSIEGITQSSGFSTQNYKYDVYIKVTALDDENVSKTYKVSVTYTYSTQNKCELLRFCLEASKNPTLTEDVECYISTYSYHVYALVPKSCDVTNLMASFEAEGSVKVAGIEQDSGNTAQDFTNVVEYEVISENGQNRKTYKVKVQKRGDIIFLNTKARGKNNGSTWKDAFIKLEDAIEAANNASGENVEIWVTEGAFWNMEVALRKAIIIRGGFKGNESSISERQITKRTKFNNVSFANADGIKIKGNLVFDGLEFDNRNIDKKLLNIKYDDATYSENSISFESSYFEGVQVNVMCDEIQRLSIKDSEFALSTKIKMDSSASSASEPEMIIENAKLHCPISTTEKGLFSILKITASELRDVIEVAAKKVKIDDVKGGKVCIFDVEEVANIRNAKIKSLYFVASTKERLGDFSIEDSSISRIEFCNKKQYSGEDSQLNYPLALGNIELKNCKDIEKLNIFKKIYANSFIMEGVVGGGKTTGDGIFMNAKIIKIKDSDFKGDIRTVFEKQEIPSIHLEVKNLTAQELEISPSKKTKGNLTVEDSILHYNLHLCGGDEIIVKDLYIGKGKFNSEVENSKIALNNIYSIFNREPIIECGANEIKLKKVDNFESLNLKGKKLVDVRECNLSHVSRRSYSYYHKPEESSIILLGQDVIFKKNTLNEKQRPIITLIAQDNFDVEGNSHNDFSLCFYHPKACVFRKNTFEMFQALEDSNFEGVEYFSNDNGKNSKLSFEECKFTSVFKNERENIEFDNCQFYGKFINEKGNAKIDKCKFEKGADENISEFRNKEGNVEFNDCILKVEFTNEKINGNVKFNDCKLLNISGDGGKLIIDNIKEESYASIYARGCDIEVKNCKNIGTIHKIVAGTYKYSYSSISLNNCDLEHFYFAGKDADVKIEKCTFKNGQYGYFTLNNSSLNFDISDSTFEINSNNFSYSTFFDAKNLKLTKCIFKRSDCNFIPVQCQYLIRAKKVEAKNTDFIDFSAIIDCIIMANKIDMEDCNSYNGKGIKVIVTDEDDGIKLKNGKYKNTDIDVYLYRETKNILLKNIDCWSNVGRYTMTLRMWNEYNGEYRGPIAARFEYDLNNLPESLKKGIELINGSLDTHSVCIMLNTLLRFGERVGVFFNLGDDEPSDSHPAKFSGNYR